MLRPRQLRRRGKELDAKRAGGGTLCPRRSSLQGKTKKEMLALQDEIIDFADLGEPEAEAGSEAEPAAE